MRILPDTSVLLSASIFATKNSPSLEALKIASLEYTLVISDSIVEESRTVIARKSATKNLESTFDELLKMLKYEKITAPDEKYFGAILISDPKDRHVVASALLSRSDAILTRDSDFKERDFGIAIMTPEEFLALHRKLAFG